MFRCPVIMVLLCAISLSLTAQDTSFKNASDQYNKSRQEAFNKYDQDRKKKFDEFRRLRNEEFAKFLAAPWEDLNSEQPIAVPVDPKPEPPLEIKENDPLPEINNEPIIFDEVVKMDVPKEQPKPVDPISELAPPSPTDAMVSFSLYGTPLKVRYDKSKLFKLKSVKESDVAQAWLELSSDDYTNLVHDCLNLRDNLDLCDWAYLQMLERLSEEICGKDTNESVLLMGYVFCQTGYKMRFADKDNKLYLLFASEHQIYNRPYFISNGEELYPYKTDFSGSAKVQDCKYKGEKPLSLCVDKLPKLTLATNSPTTHSSMEYPGMRVTVTANKNMLEFYRSYPLSSIGSNFVTQWGSYANAPLPEYIQLQLYPQLKAAIQGDDSLTAANKILNLIQTGFEYEYDERVWGYERPFFPEETLFYTYCDCEDRSILYTRIIRDVLGLKCLLVHYPNHLAAAIELPGQELKGDAVIHNGNKYYIADPTILGIGAPVGRSMSNKDNAATKLLLLEE